MRGTICGSERSRWIRALTKSVFFPYTDIYPNIHRISYRLSKSPLFFFLVGYAILKDFSYLFSAKFTGQNSTGDVMTIDQ